MKTTDGVIENPLAVFYDDGTPMLEHYGVKGMHWGVRNSETLARYNREHSAIKSKKAEAKEIKATRKKLASETRKNEISNKQRRKLIEQDRKNAAKNRSLLSEEELDARIRRLQKERQLNLLTQQELEPGRTALKQALIGVGQDTIKFEGRKTTKSISKKLREAPKKFSHPNPVA